MCILLYFMDVKNNDTHISFISVTVKPSLPWGQSLPVIHCWEVKIRANLPTETDIFGRCKEVAVVRRWLGLELMSIVNRDTYKVFILVLQSQSFSF